MFRRKDKTSVPPKKAHVVDFEDPSVKYALQGKWITLALASFKTTFSTDEDPFSTSYSDLPRANGIVHFDFGGRSLIRCELTLDDGPEEINDGSVGRASFSHFSGDDPYVLFSVTLSDRRGRIERAIHSAFESAALSNHRFVHLSLKRAEINVEPTIEELKAKGYGANHAIHAMNLTQQTNLPRAPEWSWIWSADR